MKMATTTASTANDTLFFNELEITTTSRAVNGSSAAGRGERASSEPRDFGSNVVKKRWARKPSALARKKGGKLWKKVLSHLPC
jgi:hypothetical protein